jgi:hypothetical protein
MNDFSVEGSVEQERVRSPPEQLSDELDTILQPPLQTMEDAAAAGSRFEGQVGGPGENVLLPNVPVNIIHEKDVAVGPSTRVAWG